MLLAGARATVIRDDLVEATVDADGQAGERLLASYLVLCDRSQGEHVHDALFVAGERFGVETEGYLAAAERLS
jgi:hypothetical protein